jgi:hypothetical protein
MVFDDLPEGNTQHDDETTPPTPRGPLQWMTAIEAAEARLIEEWTDEQVEALAKLGESAITFGLGSGATGEQWLLEDGSTMLVLMDLGVERDCIWSRGTACMMVGGSSATMTLPELAAALCIRLGTGEPRVPQVAESSQPAPLTAEQARASAELMSLSVNWAMLLGTIAGDLWPGHGKAMTADMMATLKQRGRHVIAAAQQPDAGLAAQSWCAAFAPTEGEQPIAPPIADERWPGMYL